MPDAVPQFDPEKYDVTQVEDDGNCLFHAMADQLNKSDFYKDKKPIDHIAIRNQVAEYIDAHWDEFKEFIAEDDVNRLINQTKAGIDLTIEEKNLYINKLKELKIWGDNVSIIAASQIFNINIKVIQANTGDSYSEASEKLPNPIGTIYLGHIPEVHYASLRPKTNDIAKLTVPTLSDEQIKLIHEHFNKASTEKNFAYTEKTPSTKNNHTIAEIQSNSQETNNQLLATIKQDAIECPILPNKQNLSTEQQQLFIEFLKTQVELNKDRKEPLTVEANNFNDADLAALKQLLTEQNINIKLKLSDADDYIYQQTNTHNSPKPK